MKWSKYIFASCFLLSTFTIFCIQEDLSPYKKLYRFDTQEINVQIVKKVLKIFDHADERSRNIAQSIVYGHEANKGFSALDDIVVFISIASILPDGIILSRILEIFSPDTARRLITVTLSFSGIKDGSLKTVKSLIAAGADVNAQNKEGIFLLSDAVKLHRYEAVILLLNAGARLENKDAQGWTALSYAVASGNSALVKLLCTRGASLRLIDYKGRTLVQIARENDHMEVIPHLVAQSIDVAQEIKLAAYRKDYELVQFLKPYLSSDTLHWLLLDADQENDDVFFYILRDSENEKGFSL